jgi:septal ring factor EnvC (AmiA/AmiB activator)
MTAPPGRALARAGVVLIALAAILATVWPAEAQQSRKRKAGGGRKPAAVQKRHEDPLQTRRKELESTQRRLQQESARAAAARQRETSLLAELEKSARALALKRRQIVRLDGKIRGVQRDLSALRQDIGRLESQGKAREDVLARRLALIYRVHAQGGAVPVVLADDDPIHRAVRVRHLASLAVLDARLIQEYRKTSERLEDRRGREEARKAELASLRAAARREQTAFHQDGARRRVLLARVQDERAYHERMVGELGEAARRLEVFIRDLQLKQRRAVRPPARQGQEAPSGGGVALHGRLPWPTEGRVVAGFGAQVHPRFGTRTFRNGVDIETVEGTEVVAVEAGDVVYTGWFKGYGNLIILDHGGELYTLYAQVASVLVKEGDHVRQGQRIGTVGDGGAAPGPRLYFEVRYRGKPQDPARWLRSRS